MSTFRRIEPRRARLGDIWINRTGDVLEWLIDTEDDAPFGDSPFALNGRVLGDEDGFPAIASQYPADFVQGMATITGWPASDVAVYRVIT